MKVCKDCHFLAKERRVIVHSGSTMVGHRESEFFELSRADRETPSEVKPDYLISCQEGYWALGPKDPALEKTVSKESRTGCRSFFWYTEGIPFEGASRTREDEQRAAESKLARRRFVVLVSLSIIGIVVAALKLLPQAWLERAAKSLLSVWHN